MQKYRDSEVKSFEFSDLKGVRDVQKDEFKEFRFNDLNGEVFKNEKVTEDTLRNERIFEKKHNFKIDTAVRDSRGLSRQEKIDFESTTQQEVQKRLDAAYQEAFNQGLDKGREEGKAEALALHEAELKLKIDEFAEVINKVDGQKDRLIEKNRTEIYEFVKRFTKWIVLKEINEKVYLENLLEKLLLELNARKNLIVKVGKANFSTMPEIIQAIEARLGPLSNVRVEVVPEIQYPGIILESENSLIDGSLEGVFQSMDKIFEQVLKHE